MDRLGIPDLDAALWRDHHRAGLGIVARRRIKSSNEQLGGLVLANIAIALNLVWLTYILVVIVPSGWKAMQTW